MRSSRLVWLATLAVALLGADAAAKVRVDGDLGISRAEIDAVLAPGSASDVDEAVLRLRLSELLAVYARSGYLDATIGAARQGEDWIVTIHAGERVTIADRRLEGVPSTLAPEVLPPRLGAPLTPAIVQEEITQSVRVAAEGGYPFAVASAGDFLRDGKKLAYRLVLDPGFVVEVESLRVVGLDLTRQSTIQRVAGFRPGPFRESTLGEIEGRLRRTSLFARVGRPTLKLLDEKTGVYEVSVEEAPATRLGGVLGVGGTDQTLNGLVDVELLNLFGTARAFRAHWEGRGEGRANYELRYREPWVFSWPVAATGAFEQEQEDTLYTHTKWTGDVEVALLERLALRVGWQTEESTRPTSALRSSSGHATRFGLAWDGRPAAASRGGSTLELTATTGSQRDVFLDRTRVKRNVTTLEARGASEILVRQVGFYAGVYGALREAPGEGLRPENLPAIGGSRSLRGYAERAFRTGRGGVATLEARRYLGPGAARLFLFVDAAYLDPDRSLGTGGDALKIGTGIGLRVASRIGLVGLDVGAAEDIRSYDEIRLHVSVESQY